MQGEIRRDRVARFGLPVAFGIAVFAVLVVRNHGVLARPIYEEGDFAGNSFLVDQALHFRLLVGNSSKYRFNHPGPAFLYVQALGQQVGYRFLHVVPAPFNGQLLGLFALQAVLIGLVTRTVQRHLRSIGITVVFMAVLLLMLSGRFTSGARLSSAWPPWLVVAPFVLALVAGASVAIGELHDLPAFAFSSGLLWHDHAAFVGLVGVSLLGLAVFWYVGHRHVWRESVRRHRRSIIVAAAIEAVFLFPVLLELVLHYPGPWGDYISYERGTTKKGLGLSSVYRFVTDYWGLHAWFRIVGVLVGLVGIAVARTDPNSARRRYLLALFGAVIWATVLTTVYAFKGVDNARFIYEAYWYGAAPAVAVAATAAAVASRLTRTTAFKPIAAVVGAGVLVLGLTGPMTLGTYRGGPWLPAAVQTASRDAQRHSRTIAVKFPPDAWPVVVGLLEQAHRAHVDMCITDAYWKWLVTAREVCSAGTVRRAWLVYAEPSARHPAGATHTIYARPDFSLASRPSP